MTYNVFSGTLNHTQSILGVLNCVIVVVLRPGDSECVHRNGHPYQNRNNFHPVTVKSDL